LTADAQKESAGSVWSLLIAIKAQPPGRFHHPLLVPFPNLALQSYDDLIVSPNGSRPGGLFPVPGQVLLRGRSTFVRPAELSFACLV
jgi:hypothetical protein